VNARALAGQMRSAGYRPGDVRAADLQRAHDAGGTLTTGKHTFRVRVQAGSRELAAVAVHCDPPVLVATESGVVTPRKQVPPAMPSRRVEVTLPGPLALELQRRAGSRSLASVIREACRAYLGTV